MYTLEIKINSVVGLFTNLRWDWLKLNFFPNFMERGGKVKSDFRGEGGEEVRQKVIFDDKGVEGGKPKSDF